MVLKITCVTVIKWPHQVFVSVTVFCVSVCSCEHQLASGARGRSEPKVRRASHSVTPQMCDKPCERWCADVSVCVCVQSVWTHPGAEQRSPAQNEPVCADQPRRSLRFGHHLHAHRNQVRRRHYLTWCHTCSHEQPEEWFLPTSHQAHLCLLYTVTLNRFYFFEPPLYLNYILHPDISSLVLAVIQWMCFCFHISFCTVDDVSESHDLVCLLCSNYHAMDTASAVAIALMTFGTMYPMSVYSGKVLLQVCDHMIHETHPVSSAEFRHSRLFSLSDHPVSCHRSAG